MSSYSSVRRIFRLIVFPAFVASILALAASEPPNALADVEEWRPVDPAELALKTPIVEPDADAEAIFWDVRVDDGGNNDLVLSNYVRIKIFTERGRDLENKINIPFLNGTKIKDVAARTIKPDGSIVELAKEDVVENTVVKASGMRLGTRSFVVPAISPGAIIEYKWKEVTSHASANNMRVQFQRDIPIQSITYHIKPADWSSSFDVYPFNMAAPEFQKEKDGFQYITVTKMPAFREEPFMPPDENVRRWALIKYHSDRRPLLRYEELASDLNYYWQPLLKVDDEIRRKATEITAGANTPEEKLEKIFVFCRTNIRNTDVADSGFTREEAEKLNNKKPADTLKRGVGEGLDINFLFAALANAAGLEARIALLPDRGHRFFDRGLVIPGALSSSTIVVRVAGSWKFFDPGVHYINTGMSRWQQEGVDALIVDRAPAWTMTTISPPEKSRETRIATLTLDENGTLEGDISVEDTGHLAIDRKEQNDDVSPNQREENLKRAVQSRLSTATLSNIEFENITDATKPFIYKYHVRIPEYAQRTGKRLFLQPGYFEKGIPALFVSSARKYSVYFHFSWSEEDKVTITLPKGYVPENADSPAAINIPGICHYGVQLGLSKDALTLAYNRSFFFGNDKIMLFPEDGYAQIKRLFDQINSSDNHTVALKQSTVAGLERREQ
jgi:hypothetical protein